MCRPLVLQSGGVGLPWAPSQPFKREQNPLEDSTKTRPKDVRELLRPIPARLWRVTRHIPGVSPLGVLASGARDREAGVKRFAYVKPRAHATV